MISDAMRAKLYVMKNRIGLVGSALNIEEYDDAKQDVAAYIALHEWDITIKVRSGFNPITDKQQQEYAKNKKITNGLESLLTAVLVHECGHWELPLGSELGCPYDTYNHDKIHEAVKKALPAAKKSSTNYVVNAFEDVIDNSRGKEFAIDYSGQILFWDNEGIKCKKEGKQHYTPFYEAFVKLNMHLIGDTLDKDLLKRHYSNDASIETAVANVIRDLNLPKDITNTGRGARQLFIHGEWPGMATIFTKHLEPLLEEQPPIERLSAFDGGEGEGNEGEDESPAGNGIEQRMRGPDGKESMAFGRYANSDSLSPNVSRYEQLDACYRRLAKDIPVNVESITKSQHFPISPLTHRPFDYERDDPSRMKVSKVKLHSDHGITFGHPDQPLVVAARYKVQRRSFPDFKMIVLDSSISMKDGIDGDVGDTSFIPWGNNSKYHWALVGRYGVEGYLQRQGIAQYVTHGATLFSTHTRYIESSFSQMRKIHEFLLSPDFGGNTQLNASVLKEALEGKESFVLSLSDGEIGDWDTERDAIRELQKKVYWAHIQIGPATAVTRDLKSWGVNVSYVNKGDDLASAMINVTKKNYDRFVRQ